MAEEAGKLVNIHHRPEAKTPAALRDLIDSLVSVNDADEIARSMNRFVGSFGFQQFVYARVQSYQQLDTIDDYISLSTLDPNWMQHYLDHDMYQHDALSAYCETATKPKLWSDFYAVADAGQLTADQQSVCYAARDWGVFNGVTIPLPSHGRYHVGVSLVGDPAIDVAEQEQQFKAAETYIVSAMRVFHACVDMRLAATKFFGLTKRETEVLKWAAEGFQAKQIAAKIGTSQHTVSKQIASAIERLKASSQAEAVAKAVLLGVVD